MSLSELKKQVDIFSLIERNHSFQRIDYKGYCHLNPCPKCGGNDHFAVYPETNSYSSFSKCCEGGSVVDFLIEVEGMSFKEANQELHRLGGKPMPGNKDEFNIYVEQEKAPVSAPTPTNAKNKFTNLYQTLSQDDYFLQRGLSKEIIEKYGLGRVTDQTDLNIFDKKQKYGLHYHPFIIPITEKYFIARLDEQKADGAKYINFGHAELLNKEYIGDTSKTVIFVTEGAFDALTIETLGHHAIALNSATNGSLLVKEIQLNEEKARQQQFILLADNDEAGEKLKEKLQKDFKNMNMNIFVASLNDQYKDINELACNYPDQAQSTLKKAIDDCKNGNSALHVLVDLFTNMKKVEPIQITEFPKLNHTIGGLRTGLYVVGAISSLGKTTFVQAIADDVASQGEHVLFFSLEMGKKELIAKSLTRTMGEIKRVNKEKGEITYTRDLLNGDIKDHDFLMKAVTFYEKTAKNLFIYEGMFDMNVNIIRQEIEKHIRLHNKKPLIIVDYLQILEPLNDRMSEKQATDKNITELKRMTRDLEIPLIAISSFNRDSYNKEASFSSFKESGSIEYGSDVVLALELQKIKELDIDKSSGKVKGDQMEALNKAKGSSVRDINLKILKNRFGKAFEEIQYNYVTTMNTFVEIVEPAFKLDFSQEKESKENNDVIEELVLNPKTREITRKRKKL